MKNLIKISALMLINIICMQSFGQRYGLKAGLNLANMHRKDNTESELADMKPGFHLGGCIDVPIKGFLSLETSPMFSTRGMKIEEDILGIKLDAVTNLNYIDLPVTLKGTWNLGKAEVYALAGPYLGVGLSGKVKMSLEYEGEVETEEEKISWGNDSDANDLKRMDYGLTMGGGLQFRAIQIGITWDYGLANISTYTENGYKVTNRATKISITYFFGE